MIFIDSLIQNKRISLLSLFLAMVIVLGCNLTSSFASPINDLQPAQSTVGVEFYGSDGGQTFFMESKITDTVLVGLQIANWQGNGQVNDLYLHLSNENSNIVPIIGERDVSSTLKPFVGVAMIGPSTPDFSTYVSAIVGSGFTEVQAGANYPISDSVKLNLNLIHNSWKSTPNNIGFGVMSSF